MHERSTWLLLLPKAHTDDLIFLDPSLSITCNSVSDLTFAMTQMTCALLSISTISYSNFGITNALYAFSPIAVASVELATLFLVTI